MKRKRVYRPMRKADLLGREKCFKPERPLRKKPRSASDCMAECQVLGIEQIFTTYDNPKENADTERLIRTVKEEAIWPYEFRTLEEAKETSEAGLKFYNNEYCHSALGYKIPTEFLAVYLRLQSLKDAA
ncbi:MAG: integrase core domain-containing protein [Candidatus Eisenbacteria bacterium]|nr:integrase core domain-containing protein [Candidatus Eisenbacteria bacterium]